MAAASVEACSCHPQLADSPRGRAARHEELSPGFPYLALIPLSFDHQKFLRGNFERNDLFS